MYGYQETERWIDDKGIEHVIYTVGYFYDDGHFVPESDHSTPEEAAEKATFLNKK